MKFRQMGKREVNLIIHRVIKDTTVPCPGCYEDIEKGSLILTRGS